MIDKTKLAHAQVWHGAIQILDESEIVLRDTIERGLAQIIEGTLLRDAVAIQTGVLREVNTIRVNAIKAAFQHVRAAYDGSTVGDRSLSEHAAIISRADVNRIDSAIRSGLSANHSSASIAIGVIGSASLNGTDGATEMTRQHIARLGLAVIKAASPRTRS